MHANYYDRRGLVIHRRLQSLTIANPGCMRVSVDDAVSGGFSDPRNTTLVKLFNLINVGDRAGTGLSTIFTVWKEEGWVEPVLEEQFNPDRTVLRLVLSPHDTENSDETTTVSDRTAIHDEDRVSAILTFIKQRGRGKNSDFANILGLSSQRVREILNDLVCRGLIQKHGNKRHTYYTSKNVDEADAKE